ncbi:MAG: fibronectin type III domain-containing protein [Flavobacteriales bacterium]|nr:fibronectin type III domain-containing protein [Flavobacteriales bacterium]
MRTKLLSLFLIFSLGIQTVVIAQSCANYAPVTRQTGISYNSIAASSPSYFIWRNTSSNQNDDNRSYQVPIGFDFWYLGVRYSNFSVSLNGVIDFSASTSQGNTPSGSSPYGSHWSNQFSTANSTMLALAPLYGDLWTGNGGTNPIATSIFYNVTGTAPNRVLTVEWLNFDHWNSPTNTPNANYNFQVKLYETTGVIEFVYGAMTGVAGGSYPLRYACGINNNWTSGGANATRLLTQQTANTTTFSSTAKNNLTTVPTSNSKLAFTPPTPNGTPPAALSFSGISSSGMTVNWANWCSNEVGYVLYNSTDNINFNFITQTGANTTSYASTGLLPGTTYYWKVYAVSDGRLSSAVLGNQATNAAGNKISVSSGNWNQASRWSPSGVPTAGDNVIIANGHTVTINANATCNNLTVGQGTSGILRIGNNNTARTVTVNNDLAINSGAQFIANTGSNTSHNVTLKGNITNNGTLNFASDGNSFANTTFNKNGNQTISGTGGMLRFNNINVNMGTVSSNTLDITASNFTVASSNFLTLTNGTFKLSSAANITPFTGGVTLPLSTGLWVNNASAIINTTGGTLTLYGVIRVNSGTLNIGNATNNNLTSIGGKVYFNGGNINIAGRLDKAGTPVISFYNMTGGTLTLNTVGSTTAGAAPFRMDEVGSTFNMSGGTIIIRRSGAGNLGYLNTGSTGSVTGGVLQIGDASTPAGQTMQINSTKEIGGLVVNNGATALLNTNPLIIANGVTVNSGVLNANNLNITLGGNWLNAGTFTPGTATVNFNGVNQSITKTTGETFNHLMLSGSGTKTLGGAITTNGNLTIGSGVTLDVTTNNYGVNVKRNWTNNGTF